MALNRSIRDKLKQCGNVAMLEIVRRPLLRVRMAWKVLGCDRQQIRRIQQALETPQEPRDEESEVPDEFRTLHLEVVKLQSELGTYLIETEAKTKQEVATCRTSGVFLDRIERSIRNANDKIEHIALEVGTQVTQLYSTAINDNKLASSIIQKVVGSDSSARASLKDVIVEQRHSVELFVANTQEFLTKQHHAASSTRDACVDMQRSVSKVDQLVFSSELLAFNVRCEAIRLGDDGSPFAVLAEEMGRFSRAIKEANLDINTSLNVLSERMEAYYDESNAMKAQIQFFADALSDQVENVQGRTEKLSSSLSETLKIITASSKNLIAASQNALSELQFQDPMSQDFMRSLHEIEKLRILLESGEVEDTSLADSDPTVGTGDASCQTPGVVEFF